MCSLDLKSKIFHFWTSFRQGWRLISVSPFTRLCCPYLLCHVIPEVLALFHIRAAVNHLPFTFLCHHSGPLPGSKAEVMSFLMWGQIRVHFSEDHRLPGQTLQMHPAVNEAYRERYHRDCLRRSLLTDCSYFTPFIHSSLAASDDVWWSCFISNQFECL